MGNIAIWIWMLSMLAYAKSAEEAEYDRLVSEMTMLSKSQSWGAVNKHFIEMEKLGLEISPSELLIAAQAEAALNRKGEFRGLLPVGDYNFGGQKFSVKSDVDIYLEISPKLRRKLTGQ